MKKFLKPLLNTEVSISLRNLLGVRPVYDRISKLPQSCAVSDLFFWRTDEGYSTQFRATDIIRQFYGLPSRLSMIFMDDDGNRIKEATIPFSASAVSVTIDRDFLGREGRGTFCAFNLVEGEGNDPVRVTNRCYTGFSKDGEFFSFVHGNLLCKFVDMENDQSVRSTYRNAKAGSRYHIQKSFQDFDYSELLFANPIDRTIWVDVNGTKFTLAPGASRAHRVDSVNEVVVSSNFCLPRPIIISVKGEHFDLHHA